MLPVVESTGNDLRVRDNQITNLNGYVTCCEKYWKLSQNLRNHVKWVTNLVGCVEHLGYYSCLPVSPGYLIVDTQINDDISLELGLEIQG